LCCRQWQVSLHIAQLPNEVHASRRKRGAAHGPGERLAT
jgi:hypothetical protein